jgi:hypothetical protein
MEEEKVGPHPFEAHPNGLYEKERDPARNGENVAAPRIGLSAIIVCHVLVCSSDVSKMDRSTLSASQLTAYIAAIKPAVVAVLADAAMNE